MPIIFSIVLAIAITAAPVSSRKAAAADVTSMHQVTGMELNQLVVGSSMVYGHPPVPGATDIFGQDYRFKAVRMEPGAEGPYRIESDRVCVDVGRGFCFKIFVDSRGEQFASFSGAAPSGLQAVLFRH